MKIAVPMIAAALILGLGATRAEAQSCSVFVAFTAYDEAGKTADVTYERGNQKKYFPKPEGSPSDTTKIPKKCAKKITRNPTLKVKATGGRMSVTQFRANFTGKMQNDLENDGWFKPEIEKLIAGKTPVVAVVRPGRKKGDMPELTTVYLPISEEELAEIKRIEADATDVE